jgi:hypothetical protein
MTRNRKSSRTFAAVFSAIGTAAGILGGAALGGCYSEGGAGMSLDEHTYYSTSWQPKTVYLKDTRTGEVLWTVDVPVGKQLTVKIEKDLGTKDGMTPDRLSWQIFDQGKSFGVLDNTLPVPGGDNKQLSWRLRPAPELPEDTGRRETPKEPPIKVDTRRPAPAPTEPGPGAPPPGGPPPGQAPPPPLPPPPSTPPHR